MRLNATKKVRDQVINMSLVDAPPILLACLERFKKQAHEFDRDDNVVFFCKEVIPFLSQNPTIAILKDSWRSHREFLNHQAQETNAQALLETKATFLEIKKSLNSSNEAINEKLSLIEKLISGQEKCYGSPLYRIIYNQLKKLCKLLLENGHLDLCKRYAKLASYKTQMQKDPNQTIKWARRLANGSLYYLHAKEVQEAHEDGEENLILFTPDYEQVEKIYIEEVTFAPTVIKANSEIDAIRWKRHQDPAIVWWYFECALWCWKTPEVYFDQIMTEVVEDYEKYFFTLCDKVVWREIACARDNKTLERAPTVFTKEFFQNGLTTLINSINIYLVNGPDSLSSFYSLPRQENVVFELILDSAGLWVKATFANQEHELFYIQNFYENDDPEGSQLFKFVKSIFKFPAAGEKKAELKFNWETVPKHMNRIMLPNKLKKAFFAKIRKSTFYFSGLVVELSDDSIEVLRELRARHLKSQKCER